MKLRKFKHFQPSNLGFRTPSLTTCCGPTCGPTPTPLLPYLLQRPNCLHLKLQPTETTGKGKFLNPPFYSRKTALSSFDRVEGCRRPRTLKFLHKAVQGQLYTTSKRRQKIRTGSDIFFSSKTDFRSPIFEQASQANKPVVEHLLR